MKKQYPGVYAWNDNMTTKHADPLAIAARAIALIDHLESNAQERGNSRDVNWITHGISEAAIALVDSPHDAFGTLLCALETQVDPEIRACWPLSEPDPDAILVEVEELVDGAS